MVPLSRRLLTIWLFVVAGLRLISSVLAYSGHLSVLRSTLFPLAGEEEVTPLYGRTFATWTLTTCFMCILCARERCDPASGLFTATLLSFVTALAHFSLEVVVFGTMSVRAAASPGLVASVSIAAMAWVKHASLPSSLRHGHAE